MGNRQEVEENLDRRTPIAVGEREAIYASSTGMISQDEFVRRYSEAHQRLTGHAASMRTAVRHYRYFVNMRKLVDSDEAVPVFEPSGREKAIDKRGNVAWRLRPIRTSSGPS